MINISKYSLFNILINFLLSLISLTAKAQNCSVNAGVDFTVCVNSAISLSGGKTGLFADNGITSWSQVSGPSAIINDPSDLASGVTNVLGGNVYRFRLAATCQDGSKVFDEVSVSVNPVTISNAGSDQVLCPGTAISNLQASALQPGETGAWTIIGNNNGVLVSNPNSPTSPITINNINSGNTTLRWTISNASCSSYDDVIITNRGGVPIVTAGASPVVSPCYVSTGLSSNASASFGGGTVDQGGIWTVINGPNIPVITNPNSNTTTFSNLIEGTYTLQWTVSGVCVNGSGQVTLVVPPSNGGVTFAGGNQNFSYCDERTSVVLNGNLPAKPDETVSWTKISGASGDIIESPGSTSTMISNMDNSSAYTFRYTITNLNGCSSSSNKTISWIEPPSMNISSVSPMILPCGTSSAAINYNSDGAGAIQWMIVSGPTTPAFPVIPTGWSNGGVNSSTINGLTNPGTYQLLFQKSAGSGSGCETIFKDFTIVVAHTPTASNAGTDQVLACNVFNTNLVGNVPVVGTGMWTQVSGPNNALLSAPYNNISPISGLISGKYVFRWLIFSGNSCNNTQDDVSVIVSDPSPTASAAGFDFETCNSTPVYLTGTPVKVNETGTWTVLPSGGINFSDIHSPTAVADGLAANAVYTFRWTINNACGISSDDVIITTNATIGAIAALAGNDQCFPSGTTNIIMNANNPSPGMGTWTKVSGGQATITNVNLRNTTITDLIDGTYFFEWAISNGGCAVTRDTVIITISSPLESANPSNAGPDLSICGTSTTMNGNNPIVGTGYWTQTAGYGGATIENPSAHNTQITGLISGAFRFQWRISNFACSASSDEVQINVSLPPTISNAGPVQSICSGTTVTMAGNNISNGTGIWSVLEGPNIPSIASVNAPNTAIAGLITGSYIFRWRSYSGPYCPESVSDVIINVSQPANAGPDQALCAASSAILNGNNSSSGTWTQVGSLPNFATIASIASNSATASGLIPGTYTFRYTYDIATGCANSDDVNVTVSAMPEQANAGADMNICDASSVIMDGNAASVGTGIWMRSSGPNNPTIVNPNSPNTTIGGAVPFVNGRYVYRWSIVNGSCFTSDEMIIIRAQSSTLASAGPDQPLVCGTNAVMAANSPVPGVGSWSQVSGGNAVIAQTIVPTTAITGMAQGSYTFRWSISNGACSPSNDDVTITTFSLPTIANAGPDQNLCEVNSTSLAGNSIITGSGQWTQISGPNIATFSSSSNPLTAVTGLIPGNYVFRWTSSNGTCSSNDEVSVNIYNQPEISVAGNDLGLCPYETFNLTANNPVVGSGLWTQTSGSPAIIQNSGSNITAVYGLLAGNYRFRWTISNGACPPSSDEVLITINEIPTTSMAGSDQNLCNLVSAMLAGNNPTIGSGNWTVVSGPNSPTISIPTLYNSSISNLIPGNYIFKWTISSGSCISADESQVNVYALPTNSNAGEDRNICGTNTFTLEGNQPLNGTGVWSVVSGPNTPSLVNPNANNSDINGLITGIYIFRWTISNGSCAASSDDVQLTVYTDNLTIANAGGDQTGSALCGLTSTTLNANGVGSPESGIWTIQSGTGGIFQNSSAFNTLFSGIAGSDYTLRWTISRGNCSTFDEVNISFPQNPTIATASDQTGASMCGINSTFLDGNTPIIGTGSWSIVSGSGGLFENSLNPASSFSGISDIPYSLKWSISNSPCPASEIGIDILFKSVPASLIIGNIVQPDCSVSTGIISLTGLPSTGNWTLTENTGNTTISGTGTNADFTGLSTNTYNFTVTNAGGCASLTSENAVINSQPLAPTLTVGNTNHPACGENGNFELFFTNIPDGNYTITHDAGNFSNVSIQSGSAIITTPPGSYNNLRISHNGCVSALGINVTLNSSNCADLSMTKTVDNPIPMAGTEVLFTILVTNNGPGTASNVIVTDILPTGYTFVSVSSTVGNWQSPNWSIGILNLGESESLTITCKVNESGIYLNSASVTGDETDPDLSNNEDEASTETNRTLIIPEGISPNGDGKNDKWEIPWLENFPENKVLIVNRWGNKVFEASPYHNDWDGTNMFGITVGGNELPVGTYFYILETGNEGKVYKGYIYLNR